jgi:hypothetical protein
MCTVQKNCWKFVFAFLQFRPNYLGQTDITLGPIFICDENIFSLLLRRLKIGPDFVLKTFLRVHFEVVKLRNLSLKIQQW